MRVSFQFSLAKVAIGQNKDGRKLAVCAARTPAVYHRDWMHRPLKGWLCTRMHHRYCKGTMHSGRASVVCWHSTQRQLGVEAVDNAVCGQAAVRVGAASPGRAEGPLPAAINRAYLARFTLGNGDLEREVLELFAGQAPIYLERLAAARTVRAWRDAAHTLKGSAAAVGALRVAQ